MPKIQRTVLARQLTVDHIGQVFLFVNTDGQILTGKLTDIQSTHHWDTTKPPYIANLAFEAENLKLSLKTPDLDLPLQQIVEGDETEAIEIPGFEGTAEALENLTLPTSSVDVPEAL